MFTESNVPFSARRLNSITIKTSIFFHQGLRILQTLPKEKYSTYSKLMENEIIFVAKLAINIALTNWISI